METGRHPGKRILFLGHDAERMGAQMALLHLLGWLRERSFARIDLVLKRGGALVDDFRAIARTTVLDADPRPNLLRWTLRRLFSTVADVATVATVADVADVVAVADGGPVDLIYLNTVVPMDLVPELAAHYRCPVVCHVHELEMAIKLGCGSATFRRAQPHVTSYIAASRAVADNLRRGHGVAAERIDQIYEAIRIPGEQRTAGPDTRRELGIPRDAFVVGGCGTMDWRKGADVFLQIAARVARAGLARPVSFVWVGAAHDPTALDQLLYDRGRLGLDGIVRFVGPQARPLRYFATFDTFLLPSREDPFPLAALEAGALGVPIVCFADAGGMPELVEDDAGLVVPYLDGEAAAAGLCALAIDEPRRAALGARAAAKVRAGHDIEVVAPRIAAVLAAHLGAGARSLTVR